MMDDARGAASLEFDRDENTTNNHNDNNIGVENGNGVLDNTSDHEDQGKRSSTALPDDLPKSLDDRRSVPVFPQETEIYDAWQGQSQFLTTPVAAKPLNFNLALDDHSHDDEHNLQAQYGRGLMADDETKDDENTARLEDSDARLMEMLAAQAAHREVDSLGADEDSIATDEKLTEAEKKDILQRGLNMAASNGDVERVYKLVKGKAKAREFVDVNMPDEEGTVPLIYASCFGHQEVVSALLEAGANVDQQDRNQWSALMWAMTNRHKTIAKILLDHGASPDIKSSSGGTAFDFAQPGSEISEYLHENGYNFGPSAVEDDFYDSGFAHGRFEEEIAENEMKRRMMMEESAINLEVDLSSLGLDEKLDNADDVDLEDDQQEFVWDKCLNDQMFVFQDNELERILDIIITNMTPQRSPSQKPVPANLLFLSARYAHYHASEELLAQLLVSATEKINDVVERHQWDMTILAFWMSNATLLLHYLKKDAGLVGATVDFQQHLAELVNEIFILIIRDAERRMNKVLEPAMLDHETIPGLEDVHFQNEWKLFRSKSKAKPPEPAEKRFRPPSPRRRAQISPRNITSLLSSTLFVLDLYDVHSVITTQILSQLLYWLSAEVFNRIMTTKRYLARTKAMQIRMNVSSLEDWARSNNRQPEHYENGSTSCTGESTMEAARRHLAPVIQLLQWLQCFSSLGDDFESLVTTLLQLQQLTPAQLLHAVKSYRPEVGEKGLTKPAMKFLIDLQRDYDLLYREQAKIQDNKAKASAAATAADESSAGQSTTDGAPSQSPPRPQTPPTPPPKDTSPGSPYSLNASPRPGAAARFDDRSGGSEVFLDPSMTLPFSLPTSTDMLISYGAGWGGTNRERARKYIPTVPPENGIRGGPSHEYSVVHQSVPSTTALRDSPTAPAPTKTSTTTATRPRPRQPSESEYPSASVMDSSRRNLVPPPSSRTLPPPPPLTAAATATPPQLPPPPLSQWQTQTQAQNNSQAQTQAPPADNDSMQLWLQAKTEEDKKKQEEEKVRQESLRLEQRVIEHSMLRDALQAGVPPHMIPLIFAGISGGSLPQVALDLTQQYMSNSVGQPASMPPPPTHQPQPHSHHHPPPSSGLDMSSSTLPPPPPSMPQYSQPPSGIPHMRRKSLYAAQPQIPPPKDTLPSQPLNISGGSSPIRQPLGRPSLPPSGPPAVPLLSQGSEIQNHHHQINTNNTQYAPGSSAPPQSTSGKDYQYRPRQPSSSIYFHHWVPPGQSQSHTASGGKEPLAPSHSHSHSRSEYHSSPGRKRKAQAGHQLGSVPSSRSRQNSPAGGGRKPSQRGHHLRQRSDASAFEPQAQETGETESNSNHATPGPMPQSTSDKGHHEVKAEGSTLEGSPSSKRRKSEAQPPSKLETHNHQSYDSDRSSRREMSKTPPKTAPSVTDDDEPEKPTGDQ